MVNFDEILSTHGIETPVEPRALFQTLRRDPKFEYLRDVQGDVLDGWFTNREKRDLIIKMNTGSGKTLIGLLTLWSRLTENKGPAVYLCPDLYLVSQVREEAKQLDIATVEFAPDNRFPLEFLNGSAILVTTIQKMINGRTVFGLMDNPDYTRIGTLLVDDAHTCIKVAREHFTASFSQDGSVGKELYSRFSEALKLQSIGAWADLDQGKFQANMRVPYWLWLDQIDQIATLFSQHQDDEELRFVWPFLRYGEVLKNCACVISGDTVEVTPLVLPIELVPSFDKSKHRIYMSATLVDDAALVRDFRTTTEAALDPIRPKIAGDIGERLIISPPLVDTKIDDQITINLINDIRSKHGINVVVLVPSGKEAVKWKSNGAVEVNRTNIGGIVSQLSQSQGQFVVLVNRYDGIDLPNDACRMLVVDGLPSEWSRFKLNEAISRTESPIIRREQAQKIEQGLGRGVRSRSDYCVVILMRNNLISFMSKTGNQEFFTSETRAQIELGQQLAEVLRNQNSNSYQAILDLVDQCLLRDAGWQTYHGRTIQAAKGSTTSKEAVAIAQAESDAWYSAMRDQYDLAAGHISKMINDHDSLSTGDRGWYLQLEAAYTCHVNRTSAFETQLKAHELNTSLLKPPSGVRYKKLIDRQTGQAAIIKDWIQTFKEPNALVADASRILDTLMFGIPSQDFESAFRDLATILGFEGHRPEHEFGKGPDVLWRMTDGQYLVVEAKNQVNVTREKIFKRDAEQIGNSALWFNQEYPGSSFVPILVHPANALERDAFVPPGCKVIQPDHLQSLIAQTRGLIAALASKPLSQWTTLEIGTEVNTYKLTPNQLRDDYLGFIRQT